MLQGSGPFLSPLLEVAGTCTLKLLKVLGLGRGCTLFDDIRGNPTISDIKRAGFQLVWVVSHEFVSSLKLWGDSGPLGCGYSGVLGVLGLSRPLYLYPCPFSLGLRGLGFREKGPGGKVPFPKRETWPA